MRLSFPLRKAFAVAYPVYAERNPITSKLRRMALEELAKRHQQEADELYNGLAQAHLEGEGCS